MEKMENSSRSLQPLTIPTNMLANISMYFIVVLPKSGNKLVLMVVVNCLSKYVNLCALQHPFKASIVAHVFMENIFKMHGMPKYILQPPLSQGVTGGSQG
jgi:hypothetical protein